MTEIIDLDLVDDFIKKPMVKQQKNQSSKPRVKRRGQLTFDDFRKTQDHKAAVLSTANALGLSRSSVTSYLPYKKGVYFPGTAPTDKISVGAERQRRYRAMKCWRNAPTL